MPYCDASVWTYIGEVSSRKNNFGHSWIALFTLSKEWMRSWVHISLLCLEYQFNIVCNGRTNREWSLTWSRNQLASPRNDRRPWWVSGIAKSVPESSFDRVKCSPSLSMRCPQYSTLGTNSLHLEGFNVIPFNLKRSGGVK